MRLDKDMEYIKYPRTYHLPWSPGATDDDKILTDVSVFNGKRVIISKKMDGECTSMYSDNIHARSLDSRGGIDRDWVKQFWATVAHNIPKNWRICGENLWATHSIQYTDLPSFFMGFSVWNEENTCLDWDTTVIYLNTWGIEPVPVMYDIIWNEDAVRKLHLELNSNQDEGYVVRLADSFRYEDFAHSVAKYVRKNHVQTDKHWRTQKIIPNNLKVK